jgi:hypothetical protein
MHMNGKGLHPAFVAHRVEAARDRSPRAVHQNIQAAEILDDPIDAGATRLRIGHVGLY